MRVLLSLLVLLPCIGSAQELTGSLPASMRAGLSSEELPVVRAATFDRAAADADDLLRDASGKLRLYARFVPVQAATSTHGVWTELGGGDRIWRVQVRSEDALATELFFEDVHLPRGSQLHLYAPDGSELQGGWTAMHVQPNGALSTGMVHGSACVIEYFEPASARGEGTLRLVKLAHAYRDIDRSDRSGTCHVDVMCSEGAGWEDQARAVVRIRIVNASGTGYCTGTLMNNTALDCKGYVLTAFHCTEESSGEAHFGNYIFRFQHQRTDCGSTATTGNDVWSCVFRAGSQDQGGEYGSDFTLLEMTNPIPASYQPYWAGWDITITGAANGVSIHHPGGDVKKISTFTSPATSTSWSGFTNGSHWQVFWAQTANGHGVTEPGSSGAALFNPLKRVVGTLTGGLSSCTEGGAGAGTGPNGSDKYGKFGYHWYGGLNPNPTAEELHWWLAPVGNPEQQNGSSDPCGAIGVEEFTRWTPHVFPLPANDSFTMDLRGAPFAALRMDVQDATGRTIHSAPVLAGNLVEITTTTWPAGIYVVRFADAAAGASGACVVNVVH